MSTIYGIPFICQKLQLLLVEKNTTPILQSNGNSQTKFWDWMSSNWQKVEHSPRLNTLPVPLLQSPTTQQELQKFPETQKVQGGRGQCLMEAASDSFPPPCKKSSAGRGRGDRIPSSYTNTEFNKTPVCMGSVSECCLKILKFLKEKTHKYICPRCNYQKWPLKEAKNHVMYRVHYYPQLPSNIDKAVQVFNL